MIKSKQLEDTLRSGSNPFDIVYADRTIGDLNGAIRFTALNNTGSTIGAYKVVYINGVSGNTPTIALADADNSSAMPAFGITSASSDTGNEVDVITFGNLKGVDTSLLSVGTILYVSTTAGEYTSTKPTSSSSQLQNIGMVVKSDANGIIKVGGAGRSAATPNLDTGKFFIGNASNQSSQSVYALPISDGSANQILATNGSGQLSFVDQAGGGGSAADDITVGDAAVTIATTSGNITIDAQGNNTDIIFKGTDNNVDIEMLRLSAAPGGTASFSNDIKLISDNSSIYFGADQEVTLGHFHNGGLMLRVNELVAGDNDPTFWLYKNGTSDSKGPQVKFYFNSSAATSGDVLGSLDFTGDDSINNGSLYNYCAIEAISKDVTVDQWAGEMQFKLIKGSAVNTDFTSALTLEANADGGSTVNIVDHDGVAEGLELAGTLVKSTASELNLLDGDTSVGASITIADTDGVIVNDGGVTKLIPASDLKTYAGYSVSVDTTTIATTSPVTLTSPSDNEEVYVISNSTSNVTVNLVAAATCGSGFKYTFKVLGTGTVTIDPNSTEYIDHSGQTTYALTQYDAVTMVTDGSNWYLI